MGIDTGYWQIITKDTGINSKYDPVNIKFEGWIDDLPKYIRDKGITVPFNKLDLISHKTIPLTSKIIKSEYLGTVENYFYSKNWEIKI